MILLAHSYYLAHDPKQQRADEALSAAGHAARAPRCCASAGTRWRSSTRRWPPAWRRSRRRSTATRPTIVGILEDNFNYPDQDVHGAQRARRRCAMIDAARERGCRVAVNGSDATDHPALYLAAGADAVILGEGETGFLALADSWSAGPGRAAGATCPASRWRPSAGGVRRTGPRHAVARPGRPAPAGVGPGRRRAPTAARGPPRTAASRGTWSPRAAARTAATGARSRSSGAATTSARRPAWPRRCGGSRTRSAPDHVWFADDIFGLTARVDPPVRRRGAQPRCAHAVHDAVPRRT